MDNWTCSANIKLLNEEMAEEVNAMEMFDLMEINCAMVEKDMITITDLEIKRVLDKKGVKRAISGPLKGPNVQVLKELPPVCLNVSGIRFGNETAIKINVRKVDLNKTVLEQDPFISAVGQPKEQTGDAACCHHFWRNPKYVSLYNPEVVTECVTKFDDSPNFSRSLAPNSSPNLVIH